MGLANNIGRYQLTRTIGEGSFAKVKVGVDSRDNRHVAVKILDKNLVKESNLKCQVKREITTMKLLHHPNIVRIHEVIGTKSKIYIVMEYVSGGQLSDKLSYAGKLSEDESRKMFQQLIDAVDYCHSRGVYHRDLKPENLLLDNKGNLKVSDFGLSALQKPGSLLSTACGSPCYVAPELLANKDYDGASADVWACGVILFELLVGNLPFDDRNLMNLYRKISRAEYKCPQWFTEAQRSLISRILDPNPKTRIKIPEIIEDPWFQRNYSPACGFERNEVNYIDDISEAFDALEVKDAEKLMMPKSSHFINAFQLIATSNDLDLSGLFEEQDENKQKMKLGSKNTVDDTLKKIEAAAFNLSLSVERLNNKIKLHPLQRANSASRCPRSYFNLSAEVTEVAPTHCVVEVSRSAGELGVYKEFCKSLTNLLTEKSSSRPTRRSDEISQDIQDTEGSEEETSESGSFRGYSSP